MSIRLSSLALSTVFLLSACAPQWQEVRKEEVVKGPARAYTAVIPSYWKRAPTDSDVLLITRDGTFLQQISITRRALDEAFPGHKIDADTPMQDLAALQFQSMKQGEPDLVRTQKEETKGVLAMFPVANGKPLAGTTEKVSVKPFLLDGKEAFRLETRSYNAWGLEYRSQLIGLVHENEYWQVRYLAPELYYASRDQAAFEAFLRNMRLKTKCRLLCSD